MLIARHEAFVRWAMVLRLWPLQRMRCLVLALKIDGWAKMVGKHRLSTSKHRSQTEGYIIGEKNGFGKRDDSTACNKVWC